MAMSYRLGENCTSLFLQSPLESRSNGLIDFFPASYPS